MVPARCHSVRADGFGRTARVMAALQRRRAIWISCFRLRWSDLADVSWPFRLEAMSATYCNVRITTKCRRPSAVQTRETVVNALIAQFRESLRSNAACAASPRAAAAFEEATHTSWAALRPGTAAVVKISAGLDCEAVSPLGSVAIPGSASSMPQTTA